MFEKFDKTNLGVYKTSSREFKRHGQRHLPIEDAEIFKGALYNVHKDVS